MLILLDCAALRKLLYISRGGMQDTVLKKSILGSKNHGHTERCQAFPPHNPMPDIDWNGYATGPQVKQYMEDYADHF